LAEMQVQQDAASIWHLQKKHFSCEVQTELKEEEQIKSDSLQKEEETIERKDKEESPADDRTSATVAETEWVSIACPRVTALATDPAAQAEVLYSHASCEEWRSAQWSPVLPPLQSWLGRWAEMEVEKEEAGIWDEDNFTDGEAETVEEANAEDEEDRGEATNEDVDSEDHKEEGSWFMFACPHLANAALDRQAHAQIIASHASCEEWRSFEWAPVMPQLQSWLGRRAEMQVQREEAGLMDMGSDDDNDEAHGNEKRTASDAQDLGSRPRLDSWLGRWAEAQVQAQAPKGKPGMEDDVLEEHELEEEQELLEETGEDEYEADVEQEGEDGEQGDEEENTDAD